MNKYIMDIFDKVNTDIPNLNEIENDIFIEIQPLIEAFREEAKPELYKKIDSAMWQALFIAEKKGFELGMKYMAKLLIECMS